MYATVTGTPMGVRPLPLRPPRAGQTAPPEPQCEVTVIVDGPRGPEMKKFKAPFKDMTDFMKHVDAKTEIEFELDINEWSVEGKNGVTYMVQGDTK